MEQWQDKAGYPRIATLSGRPKGTKDRKPRQEYKRKPHSDACKRNQSCSRYLGNIVRKSRRIALEEAVGLMEGRGFTRDETLSAVQRVTIGSKIVLIEDELSVTED